MNATLSHQATVTDPLATNCEPAISRIRVRAVAAVFPKLDLAANYTDAYISTSDECTNDWLEALIEQTAEAATFLMSK